MNAVIRPYQKSDLDAVKHMLTTLQHYLGDMDPEHRLRTHEQFDIEPYMPVFFERTETCEGAVFVAELEERLVGIAGGIVEEQSQAALIENFPIREGRIIELFVAPDARGSNIGRLLMEAMETHFKTKGCTSIAVECFSPNEPAHAFYEKLGYKDRYVHMTKKIS